MGVGVGVGGGGGEGGGGGGAGFEGGSPGPLPCIRHCSSFIIILRLLGLKRRDSLSAESGFSYR